MNRYIVAELSRNWPVGLPQRGKLLCQQFEDIIEVNLQRGYVLHSFQINRIMTSGETHMNETIIAVFVLGAQP